MSKAALGEKMNPVVGLWQPLNFPVTPQGLLVLRYYREGPSFLGLALSTEFSASLPSKIGSLRYQPPNLPLVGLRGPLKAIPGLLLSLGPRGG